MEFNNTVYAPIHDLHGNVICLVEADTGKVKEFYRYSAFGEESLYDQNGNALQAFAVRLEKDFRGFRRNYLNDSALIMKNGRSGLIKGSWQVQ